MDRSESYVRVHLHHRGFDDVIFEPSPNEPPDLLADGRIAVEVRRLNQNFIAPSGRAYGLEGDAVSLSRGMSKLLARLGPVTFVYTWSVVAEFSRPLPGWSKLRGSVEAALRAFGDLASKPSHAVIRVRERFALRLVCVPSNKGAFFTFAGLRDFDAEGSLVSKVSTNIAFCSVEKERKIARVRERYPEWWLALTDYITGGLAHFGFEVPEIALPPNSWTKILLISLFDPRQVLETGASTTVFGGVSRKVFRDRSRDPPK